MNTTTQVEAHLSEITFVSSDFDCVTFVQELKNALKGFQLFYINNASDRVQFEASTMLASSSKQLNKDDIIRQTEDQLIVKMINLSPSSTSWFVVKLNDENDLHNLEVIRKVFDNHIRIIAFDWPNYGLSMRWFAIGFPSNDARVLSLGMIDHGVQILVYWLNSSSKNDVHLDKPIIKLTPRECEVLRWVSEGKTSAEAALMLGISPKTVNLHVENAITKLRASNRTNAVARAINLGLI